MRAAQLCPPPGVGELRGTVRHPHILFHLRAASLQPPIPRLWRSAMRRIAVPCARCTLQSSPSGLSPHTQTQNSSSCRRNSPAEGRLLKLRNRGLAGGLPQCPPIHPDRLLTMDSEFSPAGDAPRTDSSESIDVVTVTPERSRKTVKIVEPWESGDSPKANGRKRQRRPNKSILKTMSLGDSPAIQPVQNCKEENEIPSTPPMMDCLEELHVLSEEIPPEPNGMEELPAFTMSSPGVFEPQSTVPYGGQAGDATPFFMPGNGIFIQGPNNAQGLPAFSPGAFVPGASVPYVSQAGDAPPFFLHSNGVLIPATGEMKVFAPHEQLTEEATRKREMRLMKNRAAAKACRLKRKEYIKHLEYTNALLEIKVQQLMQEMEVYKSMCLN